MDYTAEGALELQCPFPVHAILQLSCTAKVNDHTYLSFTVLTDERCEKALRGSLLDQQVKLYDRDSGQLLFNGLLKQTTMQVDREVYHLYAQCVSQTFLLDQKRQRRIFQKPLKYQEILDELVESADGSAICNYKKNISPPLIQYGETDWEFALRMAAMAGRAVVTNYQQDYPAFHFGLGRQLAKLEDVRLEGSCILSDKMVGQDGGEDQDDDRYDYYCYRISSPSYALLGSKVSWEGRDYHIVETHSKLAGAMLLHEYTLGSEYAFKADGDSWTGNGLRLLGEVLSCQQERVKVAFDIDALSEEEEDKLWFSYRPKTSNVFYSMPEPGARIAVKFQGESGVADLCIHPGDVFEGEDTDYRYLKTAADNLLEMYPEKLTVMNGATHLSLLDGKGLRLSTPGELSLMANDIQLHAGKAMRVDTAEQIKIAQPGRTSGIDVSAGEINIYSEDTRIFTDGSNEAPYPEVEALPAIEMSAEFAIKVVATMPSRLNVGE